MAYQIVLVINGIAEDFIIIALAKSRFIYVDVSGIKIFN